MFTLAAESEMFVSSFLHGTIMYVIRYSKPHTLAKSIFKVGVSP